MPMPFLPSCLIFHLFTTFLGYSSEQVGTRRMSSMPASFSEIHQLVRFFTFDCIPRSPFGADGDLRHVSHASVFFANLFNFGSFNCTPRSPFAADGDLRAV